MARKSPSRTAEAGAAIRALESLLPPPTGLFRDSLSQRFLSLPNRILLTLCNAGVIRHAVERLLDRRYPGVPADFICRTHFIDQVLEQSLASEGPVRLVILGAGYDTRGLRLAQERPSLDVIELDHPATQTRKARIVGQTFGRTALQRMNWVSHDLECPLRDCAALRALCRAPMRSFWIAEGLLSYLSRAAVREIFAFVAQASSPGSRIAFTYVHRDLVERRSESRASRAILRYLDRAGEPFSSGWTPEEIARDCRDAGIEIESDQSEKDLAVQYLAPRGRFLDTVEEFRVVSALVSRS